MSTTLILAGGFVWMVSTLTLAGYSLALAASRAWKGSAVAGAAAAVLILAGAWALSMIDEWSRRVWW